MAPSVSSPPTLVFFRIVSPGRHSERIYSSCNIRSIGYLRSTYGTIDTCLFRQAFPKSCGCWIVCVAKDVRSERFELPNWISRHEEDLYAFLWSKQASSDIGSPVSCLWKVVWKEVLVFGFLRGFIPRFANLKFEIMCWLCSSAAEGKGKARSSSSSDCATDLS